MVNYSQNKEQAHILKHIGETKGRFIDIGSNDGVTLSNIRAMAEIGWAGHCVEPSPKAFDRLVNNYKDLPDVITHQLAITDQDGEFALMESGELLGTGDVALVSSFLAEEVSRFPDVPHEQVMVKTMCWESFYDMIARPRFDFVSIDAEGFDIKILEQMNLQEIGVRLLCIEWNSKPDVKVDIEKLMNGYKIIYTSAENLIFAR